MLQNFEVEWSWKANEQESRREFMHPKAGSQVASHSIASQRFYNGPSFRFGYELVRENGDEV